MSLRFSNEVLVEQGIKKTLLLNSEDIINLESKKGYISEPGQVMMML
jgi:hypothetical protein